MFVLASKNGDDLIVKQLLEKNAGINIIDHDGKTAMNWGKLKSSSYI
jgi:hypothetical protein